MKILLVENGGSDFVSARLRYALHLKERGYEISILVPNDGHYDKIEKNGLKVLRIKTSNIRGKGILNKIKFAFEFCYLLMKHKFDIIHFYRLEANLIGSVISSVFSNAKLVNHITGLGYAFSGNNLRYKTIQYIIKLGYRFNYKLLSAELIFQNHDDIKTLGFIYNHSRIHCVKGSSVNEILFNYSQFPHLKNRITFLFVSRMLKEKGVLELINAFKNISDKVGKDRFELILVGYCDNNNPSAIKDNEINSLISNYSNISFLGKRSDVSKLLKAAHVGILPTYYREGTPRFLLECMATGRGIITTDMPGCNHLVDRNGLLVEPKSSSSISDAILKIASFDLREIGEKSRQIYVDQFSEEVVFRQLINIYVS